MTQKERKNRIIARGEHTNHCHVICGDTEIERDADGNIIVKVGEEGAVLKHLYETEWLNGNEVFTKGHTEIPLEPDTYRYVAQLEQHPYDEVIRRVKD